MIFNAYKMGFLKLNLILLCLILGILNVHSQNMAIHKSYTLSSSPNYRSSFPFPDSSALTDGVYTSGFFWSKETTVGWRDRDNIRIDIDLEREQPVGEVSFNTARSIKSRVNFPSNIYVFLSRDNEHYIYAGDAAKDIDNQPGGYKVKKFFLKDINQVARYVSLIVVPKGLFVFCDEIEVIKGSNKSGSIPKTIWTDNLDSAVNCIRTAEFNQSSKRHALILRENFNTSFIVEKYNAWDTLQEIHEPQENNNVLNYQLLVPVNGVQYGAFVLTNNQTYSQKFTISSTNSSAAYNLEIFKAAFVESGRFEEYADALIPLKNTITISPGNSQLLIFKISGKKIGSITSQIRLSTEKKVIYAKISGKIFKLFRFNGKDKLNAINWAYLNSPMLQNRKTEAAKDLKLHHINTAVVPSSYIPKKENNFQPFLNYLAYFKNVKNILLFTNYASEINYSNFGPWMSCEFKNNFIKWYHQLIKVLQGSGFSNSQIYLYPFDEVRGEAIERFKKFASWAKLALPEMKIYATINTREAMNNVFPYLDIVQIPSNLNLLSMPPTNRCEIWMYSSANSSMTLSPYAYYRLMAWKAFANDITGIGFWNYADERNGNNLNLITRSFPNLSGSYSVIYNDSTGNIISSRRWEAFRLGIEDYAIINAYSSKYGLKAATELVRKVTNNPNNVNLADTVREQMIDALGLAKE